MADITAPLSVPSYTVDVGSPFQAAMQGYAGGAGIRDDQQAQQARQAQLAQQQQQQQVIQSLLSNPNPTATDYAHATMIVPGLREQFKQSWDMLNTEQQQSHLSDTSQWYAAISNGQPQIAVDAMNARADAMDKTAGGATPQSQALRTQAQVIAAHPEFGRTTMGLMLSSTPGGDKVIESVGKMGQEGRAQALAPAELATKTAEAKIKGVEAAAAPTKVATDIENVTSQIQTRAKQLALDQDKLTTETQLKLKELGLQYGQLPPAVGEQVTAATTEAIAADQSAARMTDLAKRIDAAALDSGVEAKGAEILKRLTGNQNEVTRLRSEFQRIVTPAAMAAYKKVASGSTSDKDIDTAMTGVPSDTADPATMAAFLRGAAKLQVYDSVLNNAKSEWLGAVRSLAKAPTDIEIDGVKVPAGTTFKAFTDQYLAAKVADRVGAQTVQGRGYMRFAQPPGQ